MYFRKNPGVVVEVTKPGGEVSNRASTFSLSVKCVDIVAH